MLKNFIDKKYKDEGACECVNPYLYENTEVLKNKLDIRTQDGHE